MNRSNVLLLAALLAACPSSSQRRRDAPPADDCPECIAAEELDEPEYRVVDRTTEDGPDVDPAEGFEPFEPAFDAVVAREQWEETLPEGDPDDYIAVFRGDFARARGEEVSGVTKDGVYTVWSSSGSEIAQRDVGITSAAVVRAVSMVDARVELEVRRERGPQGPANLSVYRVIGEAVAEVFSAVTEGQDVSYVRRGEIRGFVVDRGGDRTLYVWNRWEGMFREPTPPPTAPR